MGRSRFGLFLQKKAVSAETNYGSFLFSLRPIHGQNIGEINFSTCFIGRRMKSTFKGIHSYASSVIRPNKKKKDVSRPDFYKKEAGGRSFFNLLFPIACFLYTLLPSPRDTLELLGQI